MKKLIPLLLILLFGYSLQAQQMRVNITGFSVKPQLPANINDWRADAVNAVAQSAITGLAVRSTKMVVQIKQGNGIKCGNTPQTASILDGFKTKIIRYNDITSVLGNCQLSAGQYSLCIQFFTTDNVASSQQQCRDFTVLDGATQGGGRDTSTIKYKRR